MQVNPTELKNNYQNKIIVGVHPRKIPKNI